MKAISTLVVLALAGLLVAAGAPPAGPYFNDLEKAAVGPPPEEFYVLNGTFAVKADGGNHFLEAAGLPLETSKLLFGPEGQALMDASAKVSATNAGPLYPEFAVGTNDDGGYRLWVLPGQQKLELRKGDDAKATGDYKGWKSGEWTSVRIRVTAAGGGKWRVEGKAWPAAGKEPDAWAVTFDADEAPSPGRATLAANPFSGTPIRFDDLKVTPAGPAAK